MGMKSWISFGFVWVYIMLGLFGMGCNRWHTPRLKRTPIRRDSYILPKLTQKPGEPDDATHSIIMEYVEKSRMFLQIDYRRKETTLIGRLLGWLVKNEQRIARYSMPIFIPVYPIAIGVLMMLPVLTDLQENILAWHEIALSVVMALMLLQTTMWMTAMMGSDLQAELYKKRLKKRVRNRNYLCRILSDDEQKQCFGSKDLELEENPAGLTKVGYLICCYNPKNKERKRDPEIIAWFRLDVK